IRNIRRLHVLPEIGNSGCKVTLFFSCVQVFFHTAFPDSRFGPTPAQKIDFPLKQEKPIQKRWRSSFFVYLCNSKA
ncbi:MAG: hypothetical protein K2L16_05315, partial [Muribaculaceae bacterium]|nr:hypothetical protein [Muribaculaceae bacterium]